MTLDYLFLKEYLDSEVNRLDGIVSKLVEHITGYKDKIVKMEQAIKGAELTGSGRKWEYGNAIASLKDKILEADIKLSHVVPKRDKLKEQVEILNTL